MSKGYQCNICQAFISDKEEHFNVYTQRAPSDDRQSYSCSMDLYPKCSKHGVAFKYEHSWYKARRWLGGLDKEGNDED